MIESTIQTDKLLKTLKIFPERVQKNIMTGAVRAATKPIIDDARKNVTVDTGNLKKSIGVVKRKSSDKSIIWFTVSPRKGGKNNGFYGHMIEFGTSKMAAQPFMRPAFENQDQQSIEAAKEYMKKRIPKEIEKAKR